ncbi:hypothetical protein EC845_4424 [Comamonas sp. BIGb0124]|uniref:hypothetical protein n=1 Tax=Comamonas sp. BIGb0124 TaxID=2485130 RepID=UPI000F480389|nr:hypothetical protein [Comamonas sp. BIGb0124]ROR16448.1 hypothetical protein EC845_4424 [Comamonas sp. BIGb0124]
MQTSLQAPLQTPDSSPGSSVLATPASPPRPNLAPDAVATPIRLAAGLRTTLCLAPGTVLLCLEGRVHVAGGPNVWGQVLHGLGQWLEAGQMLPGGQDGLPTWVALESGTPALLMLASPAPRPGWLARCGTWVARRLRREASTAARSTARPACGA